MAARKRSSLNRSVEMLRVCRAVADRAPLPMLGVYMEGHVVRYANPTFCALAGKTIAKIVGVAFSVLLPDGKECMSCLERVQKSCVAEHVLLEDKSGSPPGYHSF